MARLRTERDVTTRYIRESYGLMHYKAIKSQKGGKAKPVFLITLVGAVSVVAAPLKDIEDVGVSASSPSLPSRSQNVIYLSPPLISPHRPLISLYRRGY